MWEALADAAGAGVMPVKWRTQVPTGHPFLHPGPEERRWVVQREFARGATLFIKDMPTLVKR